MIGILKVLLKLAPVVAVINAIGGIVGVIWAVMAGDWWVILYAVVGLLLSPWVITILLMPSMVIGGAGLVALHRGRAAPSRLAFGLSSLYQVALMGVWAVLITAAYLAHARSAPLLPIMLLAYGASTTPWAYLASKDEQSGNEYVGMSLFLFEIGYVVGAALFLINPENGIAFVVSLAVGLSINWVGQQVMMTALVAAHVDLPPA